MKSNPIDAFWQRHAGAVLLGCGVWSFFVFCWVIWVLWLGWFEMNDEPVTRKDDPATYWLGVGACAAVGAFVIGYGIWNLRRARARRGVK